MDFAPLNIARRNAVVSHDAYVDVSASPSNQLVASIVGGVGGSEATVFRRGANFAIIKLEASARVDLQVPSPDDAVGPPEMPASWTTRISLAEFASDHSPMVFTDGLKILVPAGVVMNAFVVTF